MWLRLLPCFLRTKVLTTSFPSKFANAHSALPSNPLALMSSAHGWLPVTSTLSGISARSGENWCHQAQRTNNSYSFFFGWDNSASSTLSLRGPPGDWTPATHNANHWHVPYWLFSFLVSYPYSYFGASQDHLLNKWLLKSLILHLFLGKLTLRH